MHPRIQQVIHQAERLLSTGDAAGAAALYRRALKRNGDDAVLLFGLGNALGKLGDHKGAIAAYEKVVALKPGEPLSHVNLGQYLLFAGRFQEAERCFDTALSLNPQLAFALGAKVEFLQLVGRFDEARELAERALQSHPRDIRIAVAYARLAPRIKAERRAADALQRILDDPDVKRDWDAAERRGVPDEARVFVLFCLADLLDRLGDYDRAFEAADRANSLVPARFDPATHTAAVDRMLAAWNPEAIERLPRATRRTEQPLFIVGMPRSGTSLVEQILASHPDVYGAGEVTSVVAICAHLRGPHATHEPLMDDPRVLTTAKLDQAHRRYLASLYTLGARDQKRVTDKMPGNFVHLGLISRMLPGARVIHCRRDPLDTGVSCYFNKFLGANPWCYRLRWIGAYWNDYKRIMDHWQTVLTDLPIFDVTYRDLVTDPETWIRKLVEFAGLDWNDACLRFHESRRVMQTASNEQVRRPLYASSVGRHRHYDEHLTPLKEALDPPD